MSNEQSATVETPVVAKPAKGKGKGKGKAGKAPSKGKGKQPASEPTTITPKALRAMRLIREWKTATRRALIKETGIGTGWSKCLGAHTKPELGVQGGGLLGMGLIEIVPGSSPVAYRLTPAGHKALGK